MRLKILILALAELSIWPASALCQVPPSEAIGLDPYASYHGSDIDGVNMANGRLNLHIQLFTDHSQRGQLNFTYNLTYTSTPGWIARNFSSYSMWWPSSGSAQWTTVAPVMDGALEACGKKTYKDTNNIIYTEWLDNEYYGPSHPLGGDGSSGTPMEAIDGSGIQCIYSTSPSMTTWTMTNRSRIQFKLSYSTSATTETVEDPNGNMMVLSSSPAPPQSSIFPTSDTLGRSWTWATTSDFTYCPVAAVSALTWTVPAPNGGTRVFKFCYSNVAIQTNFQDPPIREYSGTTASELTGIVLPNLTVWRFDWDSYGNMTKMYLPTGGTVFYTWATTFSGCSYPTDALRVVATRTQFDGKNSYTWTYNGATVTDPLGNDAVYSSHDCAHINQVQYYSGSSTTGTLIKTDVTAFQTLDNPYIKDLNQAGVYPPVLPLATTTTWANGQVSQQQLTYDPGFTFTDQNGGSQHHSVYGLVISKSDYDYGNGSPGPALSTTNSSYLALSNSSYLSANLLDLKSSVVVLNPSGYRCAETDYAYDDPTRLFSSNVTEQHVLPPNSVRGNLSSTTQQLTNTPCQANASWTPIISYHNVYDTGMLYQSIDPLVHTSTYSYSPTYYGAYATTVTNALNQGTTNAYDFNTGLLTSTTDPNLLQTTYIYDNILRLTQANHPDGGQKNISYQESGYPFSTTVTDKINPSQSKIQTTLFDGLGRPTETQLASDPQGTVYTDTTYDARGRVATVSNPYRKGTDITTTSGMIAYGYDVLDRKISETYPDNSVLTTAYCGSSTLVTDPTGRWRRSRADGLGHLAEADEPNVIGATVASTGCPGTGEPIWVTSYSYDALSNLLSVLQNGSHQRTFTYDSLSHLLTSNNPEVGQIAYTYNNDGLLISKTDGRGITTDYSPSASPIDPLHRVTEITYSNGDPTITYSYDQPNCLGLSTTCHNIGHRTSMTDGAGSDSWAYLVDKTDFPSSPNIHRDQRTITSGSNNITKTATYYADFASNVVQAVYPTSRVVNYTYDSANRPATAADGSNGITYAAGFDVSPGGTCSLDVTCYTPQGTFYALSIGETSSFTGLNLTHVYNSRLQPQEFKASSSGGNAIDITYSFVDPANSHNAGHVFSITNNLDSTRSQTFSYDQLNRITAAQTTSTYSTSPAHCWGETYQYDGVANGAWGNLTQIVGTTNPAYTGCTQESGFTKTADANNHLSGFSYDSSGNTTGDGTFTYTWDGESQLKSAAGVNYLYDGDGRRVSKSNGKLYWYGSGGDILAETDASGNTTAEYIFFGSNRIAMIPSSGSPPVAGNPVYYVEELLGTSRVLTTNTGVVCYDADFYPYGGERSYTNTCSQNYKFEGKERDAETGNDDFGARYYSNRFGRWLSADWSAVPAPVPYASLYNPQTLNLYSIVADDPESSSDRDGHCGPCIFLIIAAIALTAYGFYHFTKTVEKGNQQAKEARQARQEALDAAARGDPGVDQKNADAIAKTKEALKTAAEAAMEGSQLPGTSSGGDLGFKPEDGATAIITTVGGTAMVNSTKKKAEKPKDKQKDAQQNGQQPNGANAGSTNAAKPTPPPPPPPPPPPSPTSQSDRRSP